MNKIFYDNYWKKRESIAFCTWFDYRYGDREEFTEALWETNEYWLVKSFALAGWLASKEEI